MLGVHMIDSMNLKKELIQMLKYLSFSEWKIQN
ncbi:hypothetical protein SDC9_168455 [bioreactor metagenome]|uniref:Uncharacterized protein n=1 Tax=bioreactor metagenome TaxID=1076179 RepID=A0A645G4L1_9ZZZZ